MGGHRRIMALGEWHMNCVPILRHSVFLDFSFAEWGCEMVSTWWLVLAFLGGGYAGFLLCAMLSVSRDTSDQAPRLVARRRGRPQPRPEPIREAA